MWMIEHIMPKMMIYLCANEVVYHASSGKYSSTVVSNLKAIRALNRYYKDNLKNKKSNKNEK
jgi:hypothetical protein